MVAAGFSLRSFAARATARRLKPAAATATACALALCLLASLPGCLMLKPDEPPPVAIKRAPPPKPSPRSEAYPAFDAFRQDLLKSAPHLSQLNALFVIGIDVSGSAHASGVLEYTTKLLTDACRYMLCPGDQVVLVPWDEKVRKDRVVRFRVEESEASLDALNKAFEDLENLVNPEHKGSNLLDARGYCIQEALKGRAEGGLLPVVFIFTDIRVPDLAMKDVAFKPDQLKRLRKDLTGSATAEFGVKAYQAGQKTQVIVHSLVGTGIMLTDATLDRMRVPTEAPAQRASAPPPPPRDVAGIRALLIVLAILCLAALIGLPFAWKHKIIIGDNRETIRAFGGRIMVQAGKGISPRGTVFVQVRKMDEQVLLTLEGKGPQLIAVSRRGVRLSDGNTELPIPLGKPFTLRMVIDGVPGEQTLELHAAEFFASNTGTLIAMAVAVLLIVACVCA